MEYLTGREALARLEAHTDEKLTCSKRLRFLIEQEIERHIKHKNGIELHILAVLKGHATYDPKTQKPIKRRD